MSHFGGLSVLLVFLRRVRAIGHGEINRDSVEKKEKETKNLFVFQETNAFLRSICRLCYGILWLLTCRYHAYFERGQRLVIRRN